MHKHLSVVFIAGHLCACQSFGPAIDQDAIIINPSADSVTALRRVLLSEIGTEVTIADSALTTSSILSVEINPPRVMSGNPSTGRIMQRPITFRLVKNRRDCILIDERDQSRTALVDTECSVSQ